MAETEVKTKRIGRPKGSKNKKPAKRFTRVGSPEARRPPDRNEPLSYHQADARVFGPPIDDSVSDPILNELADEAQTDPAPTFTEEKRPPITKPPSQNPSLSFYQRMNTVARADWGTRTWIYLYRLEPYIERVIAGMPKYITKYAEPISEERVLQDHGSGKYKAVLNYKKPAAERGEELDSTTFEVLNLKFPPKIPPVGLQSRTPGDSDWVDDPRNRKWSWAKNFFPEDKPKSSTSSLLSDLEVLDRITNRNNGSKDASEQLATVVTVAKDLAALQKPPESPAALVLEYMKLAGAASSAQLTAAQAEIAASRERGDKLMMMLLERDKKPEGNNFNMLKEVLSGIKDFLPTIKEIIPEAANAAARSRMSGWQEFTAAVMPHATEVLKPFAHILAQVVMVNMQNAARANGAQPPPAAQPQQQPTQALNPPNGQAPPAAAPPGGIPVFLNMIASPMMNAVRFMAPPHNDDPADTGSDFAQWVYDGYASDPRYEEALGMIKMLGPLGAVQALKQTVYWTDKGPAGMRPSMAELEPQFQVFMSAFLNWQPSEDDGRPQPTPIREPGEVENFDEPYQRG